MAILLLGLAKIWLVVTVVWLHALWALAISWLSSTRSWVWPIKSLLLALISWLLAIVS